MDLYDYEFEPTINVIKRWYKHWYNVGTTWLNEKFLKDNSSTLLIILIFICLLVYLLVVLSVCINVDTVHNIRVRQLEAERLDLEEQEDALLQEKMKINMLRKKRAEEYRRSVAFKTIMDQVGTNKESWPVLLVDQMLHLQEEIENLKKE